MSLWVDKYRPTSLSTLDYHVKHAEQLQTLVKSGDFPHLLVYGPSGAGKKTRITCILRELYGNGVEKVRIEHKTFDAPSGKRLEITSLASNYHIELNPSDVGIYDRVVVQEVIKSMAQTQQLDSNIQKDFKVVVLNEVDKLTKDAQHALRRTMEKYTSTCRLILCCQSTSKVIPPVRSRCLAVRVPAPTEAEIVTILERVCKKEKLTIPKKLAERIAERSQGNLRRALLMAETCSTQNNNLPADMEIAEPDWEIYVKETADFIIQEQSPKRLYEVRGRLFELLTHCVPPDVIFKKLLLELLHSCDAILKAEITAAAAQCEYQMQLGSKPIYHLEAFVAKFMSLYKKYLEFTLKNL